MKATQKNVVFYATQNGKKSPGIVVEVPDTQDADWYKKALAEAKSRTRLSAYKSWAISR